MSKCQNCDKQVQQLPGEIPTHADGTVFCGGPFNHEDKRVAQLPACPICQERPADPAARPDARGRRWCIPCQDEHDSIDWDKIAEERLGQ